MASIACQRLRLPVSLSHLECVRVWRFRFGHRDAIAVKRLQQDDLAVGILRPLGKMQQLYRGKDEEGMLS